MGQHPPLHIFLEITVQNLKNKKVSIAPSLLKQSRIYFRNNKKNRVTPHPPQKKCLTPKSGKCSILSTKKIILQKLFLILLKLIREKVLFEKK